MSSFVHFCADQSNGTVSGAIWRTVGSPNTKAAAGAAGSRNAVRTRPSQPARANQAAGMPVALRLFTGNAFKLAPTPALAAHHAATTRSAYIGPGGAGTGSVDVE